MSFGLAVGCDLESKSVGDPSDSGPNSDTEVSPDPEVDPICYSDFLPADGFGWQSDIGLPLPTNTGAQTEDGRPSVVATCQAEGGMSCDIDTIITRESALCIAEDLGLPPGIGDITASLVYHHGHDRPVWNLSNLLSSTPDGCEANGQAFTIDASTGAPLNIETEWNAFC